MSLSAERRSALGKGALLGALGGAVLLVAVRVAGPLKEIELPHVLFALLVCPLLGALAAWLKK
jgi:hypothetical protein